MKRLLVLGLAVMLLGGGVVFAADGDITKAEVRKDVATYQLDTVKFLVFTSTCEVSYRKVDADGNPTGGNVTVRFQNIADNPETPEDESSNEFSQLINLINNNDNIKASVTQAVRTKLGI